MASNVRVEALQTLVDIAMQEAGDAAAFLPMALALDLSITDDLAPGTLLPKPSVINKTVVAGLAGAKPASGIDEYNAVTVLEGIDYWAVETQFIVS